MMIFRGKIFIISFYPLVRAETHNDPLFLRRTVRLSQIKLKVECTIPYRKLKNLFEDVIRKTFFTF